MPEKSWVFLPLFMRLAAGRSIREQAASLLEEYAGEKHILKVLAPDQITLGGTKNGAQIPT